MAPQKRKHPHDAATGTGGSIPGAPARRSTRQHPDAALVEPDHQLRSGRARAVVSDTSSKTTVTRLASRGRRWNATKAVVADVDLDPDLELSATVTIQTRATATRNKANTRGSGKGKGKGKGQGNTEPPMDAAVAMSPSSSKENVRPPTPSDDGKKNTAHLDYSQSQSQSQSQTQPRRRIRSPSPSSSRSPKPRHSRPRPSSTSQSHALAQGSQQQPAYPVPKPGPVPVGANSGPPPPAAAAAAVATVHITPKRARTPPSKPKTSGAPGTPHSDRNIDQIVFGTTCFKAWYPSYYGKEVLGDVAALVGTGGAGPSVAAGNAKIGGGKRDTPILERLYVCPCCFKYSREMIPWWKHVQYCQQRAFVPGIKVYTHPSRSKMVRRPRTGSSSLSASPSLSGPMDPSKGKRRTRPSHDDQQADAATTNEGEWSVWEVDGEKDGLFCQNLSLFAKLFLDNKSVFFDVTGFNYFLLVYTPRISESHAASPSQAVPQPPTEFKELEPTESALQTSTNPQLPHSRPQIVGFYSKEKMSWDNNNLACILVFPPWQRKGLGALLMGVSYEISRREGILGGPEKPISELGRKGYKRFWAGEIIRWILGLDLPATLVDSVHTTRPTRREEKDRGKDKVTEQDECVVDVEKCSRDTWIVLEDCLAVLREMGVVEDAGLGFPGQKWDGERDGEAEPHAHAKENQKDKNDKGSKRPRVPRVRVDKAAARRWALENHIDLARACDPDGFVDGYAIRQGKSDDEEK
ncbi:acyl-CoA N-acyltransferase [Astrocystis sublimbata]|nr:acyl-CoA N-acyltransferase [Astrocystis sublimbata]